MTSLAEFDIVVIGGGPAGHKAAICGAKAGKRVLVIEEERAVGGACVSRGTIPSKTLRETALALSSFRKRSGDVFTVEAPDDLQVRALMQRLDTVVSAHERFMGNQLDRNNVTIWHGRARFSAPNELAVRQIRGEAKTVRAPIIVIATGSRPRAPAGMSIDHENVLDSDSILAMAYLPRSIAVLGAGVIASEYASIFAALGVEVTMIDRGPRPLGFVDAELVARFVGAFEGAGGRFIGGRTTRRVEWNGAAKVVIDLDDESRIEVDKVLVALGRVANVEGLSLEKCGLSTNERGLIPVDDRCRTEVAGIYAVGDVIGPPSLAASSMEQGRRAVCDALGIDPGTAAELVPAGIYTIPEMASVGMDEATARKKLGGAMVGRAPFSELARGHIAAIEDGLLKLIADGRGEKIVGVHVVGEGATELVAVGQIAIQAGFRVDQLVESIFNFPTLAEAYRVAALDIAKQRV